MADHAFLPDRRQFLGLSIGGALTAVLTTPAHAASFDYGIASIDPIYSAAYVALKKGLAIRRASI